MQRIHISTARRMLQAPEPVDLKVWKKNGEIMELKNAIGLRYNFYEGTMQMKRKKRQDLCCIPRKTRLLD